MIDFAELAKILSATVGVLTPVMLLLEKQFGYILRISQWFQSYRARRIRGDLIIIASPEDIKKYGTPLVFKPKSLHELAEEKRHLYEIEWNERYNLKAQTRRMQILIGCFLVNFVGIAIAYGVIAFGIR